MKTQIIFLFTLILGLSSCEKYDYGNNRDEITGEYVGIKIVHDRKNPLHNDTSIVMVTISENEYIDNGITIYFRPRLSSSIDYFEYKNGSFPPYQIRFGVTTLTIENGNLRYTDMHHGYWATPISYWWECLAVKDENMFGQKRNPQ